MAVPQTITELLTYGLSPVLPAIIFGVLLVLLIPVIHHLYLYRKQTSTNLPTFLLVGPSGAGKTSLTTLFERGTPAATHMSQKPLTVETSLPVTTVASSDRFRSVNDTTNQFHKKILLVDTPGHGKLRHFALENIINPQNLKGIIYVVDATTLSSSIEESPTSTLAEAAGYLHDVLLALQKRSTSKSSKAGGDISMLIAANKLDLFTALPARLVKISLENEITKLRSTRSRGLMDSGVGMSDDLGEEQEILGGGGEGRFTFELLEEYNIFVEVVGGAVSGADGPDVAQWWEWIAGRL